MGLLGLAWAGLGLFGFPGVDSFGLLGLAWLCFGFAWACLGLLGIVRVWSCLVLLGLALAGEVCCVCLTGPRFAEIFLDLFGLGGTCLGFLGFVWVCLTCLGLLVGWTCLEFFVIPWACLGLG